MNIPCVRTYPYTFNSGRLGDVAFSIGFTILVQNGAFSHRFRVFHQVACDPHLYPLVMTNIAIENGPFIVDFPIENGDLP